MSQIEVRIGQKVYPIKEIMMSRFREDRKKKRNKKHMCNDMAFPVGSLFQKLIAEPMFVPSLTKN